MDDKFIRTSAGQNINPEYVEMVRGISEDLLGKIEDEKIAENYVNKYYLESIIRASEEQLLYFLKMRQEKFPLQKNDEEWSRFSDWVIHRRKG